MYMKLAVLLACLATISGEDAPHGYEAEPHSDVSVPAVPSELAIFLAKTSAATATSFVLEHTKVTITKHAGSSSSALTSGRRPRIIVTDAAARGLVCVPKGRLTKKDSSAAEAETIDSAALVEEEGKADVVIGQGQGVTASASSGGASAAAAASSGGAAAAASSGGSAAAASSGDAKASATSAGGSSASAASSGDSAAAATSGDAEASAHSAGGSSVSASSSDDSAAVATSGDAEASAITAGGSSVSASSSDDSAAAATSGDAEASAITSGGSSVSASSSDDSAAAASTGDAEASATSSSGKSASVSSSGDSAAAATAGDAEASATHSEGSSVTVTSSGDSTAAATSGDAQAEASSSSSHSSASSQEGGYDVDVGGEDAHASATDASGSTISTSTDGKSSEDLIIDGYCECVPDYLCDDEGYINTFGAGLIDIRFNEKKAIRKYDSRCKQGQTCCRHREGEERSAIGWLPTACGTRSPVRLDRRIVRGEAVRIGENPWIVAILKEVTSADGSVDLEYLCGGSLVEEDIVLTAAHCVHEHKGHKLVARVGEWDTSSDDEIYPHQDIIVSRVLEHEKFNPKTLFNDVAVLKLSELAEVAPHVGTICLPEDLSQVNLRDCVATGWGKESFTHSVYASILKEVPLSLVDSGDCQAALRTTRLSRFFRLHKSFTCAGGEPGVDTCKGDGGSPLVCRGPPDADGEDTFVQVGIVAWGIGCGQEGIPGVYADVRKLLPWIHEHIAELHGSSHGGYKSAPLSGDDDGGAGDDLGSADDALGGGADDAVGGHHHSHGY